MDNYLALLKSKKVKTQFFLYQLLDAAKHGTHVFENQLGKINNLPCVLEDNNHYKIRDIFIEYWDLFDFGNEGKIRPSVKENVIRMMHCKDFSKGFLAYECPNFHNMHYSGLSCNSRFCSSCGNRYREQRTLNISKKCIAAPHRQFVFSIPFELRNYFLEHEDRDTLLDILFKAVEEAFEMLIKNSKKAKKENRQLGYMLFLHTLWSFYELAPSSSLLNL